MSQPDAGQPGGTGQRRMRRAHTAAEVESALTSPGTHVIFLHDPWCPVSDRANGEMERVGHDILMVDVSTQRDLSKLIAERTRVRHESPQVFVVSGGTVKWHASHGRITREAVTKAVAS